MLTIIYLLICWLTPNTISIPILLATIAWDVAMFSILALFAYKVQKARVSTLESLGDMVKQLGLKLK